MRVAKFSVAWCGGLVGAGLLTATGCLSLELGTKPTTITESAESKARLAAIEARVEALERMLRESETTVVAPTPYTAE